MGCGQGIIAALNTSNLISSLNGTYITLSGIVQISFLLRPFGGPVVSDVLIIWAMLGQII